LEVDVRVVKSWSVAKPVPSVFTAKTVPNPPRPPSPAVPYRVLPDKTKPDHGRAPSLFVGLGIPLIKLIIGPVAWEKLCRTVKPVPFVLRLNTVPSPELPPWLAVPYRVLPDKISPAYTPAPSLLVPHIELGVVKVYRVGTPLQEEIMGNDS
jgi:hypothetical protein